jgi:hypothetical protein
MALPGQNDKAEIKNANAFDYYFNHNIACSNLLLSVFKCYNVRSFIFTVLTINETIMFYSVFLNLRTQIIE